MKITISKTILILALVLVAIDAWIYTMGYIREFRFHQEAAARITELEKALNSLR